LQGVAATAQFWPWANTLTNVSPLTRDQQTVAYPGVVWRATLSMPPLSEPSWRLWSAFLGALQGTAGRFNLRPPQAPNPQGQAAPATWHFTDGTGFDDGTGFFDPPHTVVIRSDVDSSKILLRTAGWQASTTVLRAGDYICWSHNGRRMLGLLHKDAISDGAGNADLKLAFPAPEIPSDGKRLYIYGISVTMRLIDDEQAAQGFKEGRFGDVTLDAIEAAP
jgi:hypothetical protein